MNDAVGDPNTCHFTAIIVWCFWALGIFFILSTHFHYSVDVYIGFCLTALLFHVYHYYVKISLQQKTFLSIFIRWFEGLQRQTAEDEDRSRHGGEALPTIYKKPPSLFAAVSLMEGIPEREAGELQHISIQEAIREIESKQHITIAGPETQESHEPSEGRPWY